MDQETLTHDIHLALAQGDADRLADLLEQRDEYPIEHEETLQ